MFYVCCFFIYYMLTKCFILCPECRLLAYWYLTNSVCGKIMSLIDFYVLTKAMVETMHTFPLNYSISCPLYITCISHFTVKEYDYDNMSLELLSLNVSVS